MAKLRTALLFLSVVVLLGAPAPEARAESHAAGDAVDLDSLHAPFVPTGGDITASYTIYLGGFRVAQLQFFISDKTSRAGFEGGFHHRMSGQTTGWAERLAKRSFLAVSQAANRQTLSGVAVSEIFYWSQFRALENTEAQGETKEEAQEQAGGFLAHEALRPRYFLRNATGEIETLGGTARWAGTRPALQYGADDGRELSDTVDLLAFFARFFTAQEGDTTAETLCQTDNQIYDGKYLYRVTFDSVRKKDLNLKKYTPYRGTFTHCRLRVEALGGVSQPAKARVFSQISRVLAAPRRGRVFCPVLFTFRTRFGLFLGYLQEAEKIR